MTSHRNEPYAGHTVLGVFPHPDDEAWSVGGTLALCADGGATVHVASATRGEHGPDFREHRTGSLAEARANELAASCAALGAEPPIFLEWADGAVPDSRDVEARRTIAALLETVQPDVVITLGPEGGYGHLDHIALSDLVTMVVSAGPVRLLHAGFPRGIFEPIWQRLRKHAPLIEEPPRGIDAPDLSVAIHEARETKLRAIAAHRSQLPDGTPDSMFAPGFVERHLLESEWFAVAGGPALPADPVGLFAGLAGSSRTG